MCTRYLDLYLSESSIVFRIRGIAADHILRPKFFRDLAQGLVQVFLGPDLYCAPACLPRNHFSYSLAPASESITGAELRICSSEKIDNCVGALRCLYARVRNVAFGPGAIEPRVAGTQEGFPDAEPW